MSWINKVRDRIFRPGEDLESADRRALMFGAAVTSAGLLIPKTIVSIAKPRPLEILNSTQMQVLTTNTLKMASAWYVVKAWSGTKTITNHWVKMPSADWGRARIIVPSSSYQEELS